MSGPGQRHRPLTHPKPGQRIMLMDAPGFFRECVRCHKIEWAREPRIGTCEIVTDGLMCQETYIRGDWELGELAPERVVTVESLAKIGRATHVVMRTEQNLFITMPWTRLWVTRWRPYVEAVNGDTQPIPPVPEDTT